MNTLLDGHVKLGRMHDAETVLKGMEERGVRGNVVVYNTLLRGYARAGNSRVCSSIILEVSYLQHPLYNELLSQNGMRLQELCSSALSNY